MERKLVRSDGMNYLINVQEEPKESTLMLMSKEDRLLWLNLIEYLDEEVTKLKKGRVRGGWVSEEHEEKT